MPSTFTISDEPMVTEEDLVAWGNGRHLIRVDLAGAEVYVQVEDGKIVGRSAERDGQEVEIVDLRVKSGQKDIEEKCYWCCLFTSPPDPPTYICGLVPCDHPLAREPL
jgi:hypothetical protein